MAKKEPGDGEQKGGKRMSSRESLDEYEWSLESKPDDRDRRFLSDRINEDGVATTGIDDGEGLIVSARDGSGQIVAGLSGRTWGGCLHIQYLWVKEDLRSQGYGRRLMLAAETEAIKRGCHVARLSTHSFQAPGFYEKLGYHVSGVVEDYPKGHQYLGYVKALSQA